VPKKGKRDFIYFISLSPLPMASISSFYYKNPKEVFDFIDDQFTLKPDSLIELTKTFLDEVKTGLSNYNQAMAMMYAFVFHEDEILDLFSVPHLLQVFPMVQRLGVLQTSVHISSISHNLF
jgi:hypothetical protein